MKYSPKFVRLKKNCVYCLTSNVYVLHKLVFKKGTETVHDRKRPIGYQGMKLSRKKNQSKQIHSSMGIFRNSRGSSIGKEGPPE